MHIGQAGVADDEGDDSLASLQRKLAIHQLVGRFAEDADRPPQQKDGDDQGGDSVQASPTEGGRRAGVAPLELRAELDEFAHIFSAPTTSEGVVRLRVTAVAPGGRAQRLVGQRTFEVRQPAATADAPGGVSALRAASDEVVRQVVAWVNALPAPAADAARR